MFDPEALEGQLMEALHPLGIDFCAVIPNAKTVSICAKAGDLHLIFRTVPADRATVEDVLALDGERLRALARASRSKAKRRNRGRSGLAA